MTYRTATPLILSLGLLLGASLGAFAGEETSSKKIIEPPQEEEHWKLLLAVPGWMPGVDGTAGVDGANSHLDIRFNTILHKLDMVWATRAEISRDRFGILGELIYLSMSDGVGTDGVIKKLDIRADEYLADFTLRYRLLEGPRGYIDALTGVRYTNLYQSVSLRPNDEAIERVASNFTDELSAQLREQVDETLSKGDFRNALENAIHTHITDDIDRLIGAGRHEHSVPAAPLAHGASGRIETLIKDLVQRKAKSVVAAATADLQAAKAADEAAARQAIQAERIRLQRTAAVLRQRAEQRVSNAQREIDRGVQRILQKELNQNVSRVDDWWDPYVGLRARYNFTKALYVIARGDIGGFGVGSELMWQAEGALGIQLTRNIYGEVGYRALSFDYHQNGLFYDTITHGAQITVGIIF